MFGGDGLEDVDRLITPNFPQITQAYGTDIKLRHLIYFILPVREVGVGLPTVLLQSSVTESHKAKLHSSTSTHEVTTPETLSSYPLLQLILHVKLPGVSWQVCKRYKYDNHIDPILLNSTMKIPGKR